MDDLEGQVAIVTGGGRGIGETIARRLAAEGMRVAVTARTREQVERVAEEIGGLAIVTDVSERDDVEVMVAEVERELGAVDLLVANAAIFHEELRAWELDPDDWWHTFEVNVLGVYLSARAVIPSMIERGQGRIAITSSGSSYFPDTHESAYGASKAAVNRLGETLALQLAPYGVGVFEFSPGTVLTSMNPTADETAPGWAPPEAAATLVHAFASGRFDALSGRYLHAKLDRPDEVELRIEEILRDDLHTFRLRR